MRDPLSGLCFSKNSSLSLLTDSLHFIKYRQEKSVWNKVSLKCTALVGWVCVFLVFLFSLPVQKQNSKSCHNFLFCYIEKEITVMNFLLLIIISRYGLRLKRQNF